MEHSANLSFLKELALYCTISSAIVLVCITAVLCVAFYRTGATAADALSALIERAGAVQMLTVMVIVVGACILASVEVINSEGIVSILSGIAGYVLGNAPGRNTKP